MHGFFVFLGMVFTKSIRTFGFFLLLTVRLFGQGDGAKAFILMPKKTFMPAKLWVQMKSQTTAMDNFAVSDAHFHNTILMATFPYTFGIGKRAAQLTLYTGFADVKYQDPTSNIDQDRKGMIDPVVNFTYGLIHTPALDLQQWMDYSKPFKMWSLLGVSSPIGSYKKAESLNIGIHKWSFRFGLPMTYEINRNSRFASLVEMTPSITLFTANRDPFLGDNQTQEPLFVNEFHFNQNLGKTVMTTLDFRIQEGGRTFTDGKADHNRISQYSLGMTAQYTLKEKWLFRASYGYRLFSGGSSAHGYRIGFIFIAINRKYKRALYTE